MSPEVALFLAAMLLAGGFAFIGYLFVLPVLDVAWHEAKPYVCRVFGHDWPDSDPLAPLSMDNRHWAFGRFQRCGRCGTLRDEP